MQPLDLEEIWQRCRLLIYEAPVGRPLRASRAKRKEIFRVHLLQMTMREDAEKTAEGSIQKVIFAKNRREGIIEHLGYDASLLPKWYPKRFLYERNEHTGTSYGRLGIKTAKSLVSH